MLPPGIFASFCVGFFGESCVEVFAELFNEALYGLFVKE